MQAYQDQLQMNKDSFQWLERVDDDNLLSEIMLSNMFINDVIYLKNKKLDADLLRTAILEFGIREEQKIKI